MVDREIERGQRLPPMTHYAKAAATVTVVLVLFAAAWEVQQVLILVLIAGVLAIGLDPAVRKLQRLRFPRGWAVTAIVVAAVAVGATFASLVIPPLVREAQEFAQNIPEYIDRLERSSGWIGDLERRFNLSDRLRELVADLPSRISGSVGTIFGFTRGVASFIFNTLTVSILTIYFLLSLPRLHKGTVRLFRQDRRKEAGRVVGEMIERIGGYLSGNIVVSIIAGAVSFVALLIIGVPFPAALAIWVAFTDLIPVVGALLGAVLAVIVAAFSSTADAVATGIFFLVYQQIENYFIAPRVMKEAVDLSPAAVIISVMIGGSLGGFAGALLALPIAAAAKVVVQYYLGRERPAAARPRPA
jgi:predicted PurR-regulated permease PerM